MRAKRFSLVLYLFLSFSAESSDVLAKNKDTRCVVRSLQQISNETLKHTEIWKDVLKKASTDEEMSAANLAALPASDRMSSMRNEKIKKEERKICKAKNGVFLEQTNQCVTFEESSSNITKCSTMIVARNMIAAKLVKLGPEMEKRLSLGGIIISEISLAVLLATYCFCKELQTPYGKCVVILSITTMAEQAMQIISFYSKDKPSLCTGVAITQHWMCLAMFFWMASIAYDLCYTFSKVRPPSSIDQRKRFKIYICVSEVIPTLVVASCVVVDFSSKNRYIGYGLYGICFITRYWPDIITFLFPVGCVLTFNLICLCITLFRIRRAARKSETLFNKKNNKSTKPSLSFTIMAMKLSFLLGFSWVIGYFGSIFESVALIYAFMVVNSYQGVLIFIAFCCNQRVFRFYKGKFPSRLLSKNTVSTHTASSKRSQETAV